MAFDHLKHVFYMVGTCLTSLNLFYKIFENHLHYISMVNKLDDMYTIICITFRSRLLKASIAKFRMGQLSSVLISEIIKTSVLPLTCSKSTSNLFRIELMFKWAKTNIFLVSLCKWLKNLCSYLFYWFNSI